MSNPSLSCPQTRYISKNTLVPIAALLLLLSALPAFCVDVTLTVLDAETEEPVAGAAVQTYISVDSTIEVEENLITDSEGQCYLNVRREKPEHYYFSVTADGYLVQNANWRNDPVYPKAVEEGAVPEEYTIRLLKPDSSIGGIVKDETGYPIEDVKVIVFGIYESGRESTRLMKFETLTDQEGKWTCDRHYSKFNHFSIEFTHPEYSSELTLINDKSSEDINALRNHSHLRTLYKGLIITGLVRDAAGNPIEGARVDYSFKDKTYSYTRPNVKTDYDGFYTIPGAVEGEVYLIANADGYAHKVRKFILTGETMEQNFRLEKGLVLEGLVLDSEDNPVPGALVSIQDKDNYIFQISLWSTYTDEAGRFEWKSAPPNGGRIWVHKDGYMTTARIVLAPRPSAHVIRLLKQLLISGRVTDSETMEPIREFSIVIGIKHDKGSDISWWFDHVRKINDADGKYAIPFSYPGLEYYLRVEADGYETYLSRPFMKDEGAVTYDIGLKKSDIESRRLEGTIIEKYTNKPLAGVKVTLIDTSTEKLNPLGINWVSFDMGKHRMITTETDENGKFFVEKFIFKKAAAKIEKKGYARTFIKDIDCARPFHYILPKGASISGYYPYEGNIQKPNQWVYVKFLGGIKIQMGSDGADHEGFFRIEDLPAGRYLVNTFTDHREDKVHIADVYEGQDYTVNWDGLGVATLHGSYIINSIPIEGMSISAFSRDEMLKVARTKTKPDGSFHLNLPFIGLYRLSFEKEKTEDSDAIYQSRDFEIMPGLNRLDIILGSQINGKAVFMADNEPVADTRFAAFKKEPNPDYNRLPWGNPRPELLWWPKGRFSTDQDGAFKVDKTSPGEWMLVYYEKGIKRIEAITIPSKPFILKDMKQEKTVLFRIPETVMLRLNIIDKNSGEKLKDIIVSCRNQDGFVFTPFRKEVKAEDEKWPKLEVNHDEEDRLLFRPLPPGKYSIYSRANDKYPVFSTNFEVPEIENNENSEDAGKDKEEFIDLTLEMEKGGRIVFNLPDDYKPDDGNEAYIGYYLGHPENDQPVLKDAHGPYWGEMLKCGEDNKAYLSLQPGEYILQAVLKETIRNISRLEKKDLWNYTAKVTIEKDKDTKVNIELDTQKSE